MRPTSSVRPAADWPACGGRGIRRAGLVRWTGGAGAVIPLLALVFVLATLIIEALPAIGFNGLHFFTGTAGTLATSTGTPWSATAWPTRPALNTGPYR